MSAIDRFSITRLSGRTRLQILTIIVVSFAKISSASPSFQADPDPMRGAISPAVAVQLQDAIDAWAATSSHKGVSASVILANGDEWIGASGDEGDGQALTPEHLIWIASITKTMTGAVILGLAQDGILDLDDPLSRWIDAPRNVDPEITVRQLLNHTGGLANYTRNPALGTAISADQGHLFTADELIAFVGPRSFERGQRTQYTNTSFVLLGMIAAEAGQKPIMDLYHERLWDPLELEEIFLAGQSDPAGPVADAWMGRGQNIWVSPMERMSLLSIGNTAFGMFSNARTVARWGRALFSGQVLGASMRQQMVEFVPAAGNIPGESGSGLGIRQYNYLDREQWGHSGGSPLGSSLMFFDPDTGITVAVIMNQGGGANHFNLAPQLLKIVTP